MQAAALLTMLLVCDPAPEHQAPDSTAIHKLIFESLRSTRKTLLLDRRVMERLGEYNHAYRGQHSESCLEYLITSGLVEGVCEPVPSNCQQRLKVGQIQRFTF